MLFCRLFFVFFWLVLYYFLKVIYRQHPCGLALWANHVVPSLLPFFIGVELLSHTSLISVLGKILNPIMRPIFNVPGQGAFALVMGILCGYPTGAKIVTKFREDGICTKEEAERLLSFTNNSGPLFIVGTVGISLFADTRTGFLLLLTHIAACLSVGFCFRFWKCKKTSKNSSKITSYHASSSSSSETASFANLGGILSESIMSSVRTIVMIGGFVVLFSVVISILKQSHVLDIICFCLEPLFNMIGISLEYLPGLLTGTIELTNGVKEIAAISSRTISTNVILCSFLLGFGGFSVLLQVFSITSKSDISIKPYFYGKLLQGLLAAFYTFILLNCTTFFNLDLVPVFANHAAQASANSFSLLSWMFGILWLFLTFSLLVKFLKKQYQ